jgi:hypothetical protein
MMDKKFTGAGNVVFSAPAMSVAARSVRFIPLPSFLAAELIRWIFFLRSYGYSSRM